jgi:hypothetical protein
MYRSGTSSNDYVPLQISQPAPSHEDTTATAAGPAQTEPLETVLPHASRIKEMGVKKKLTPNKHQIASACAHPAVRGLDLSSPKGGQPRWFICSMEEIEC